MTTLSDRFLEWFFRHPLFEKTVTLYQAQSERDQKALAALGVFVLGTALVFGLAVPAHRAAMSGLADYEKASADLAWMKSRESDARSGGQHGDKASGTIESIVTAAARESGVSMQRYEPAADGAIRVWLVSSPFQQVMLFINNLETQQGLKMLQVDLERADTGLVNVSLMVRE